MKKVIVISGPTGIGKSKIAFNISKKLQKESIKNEIILCDSIQIYKEVDLLANKPPKDYLSQSSYNLISTYSLKNPIHASNYAIESRKLINKFLDEGKVPILEGGSGFYLKMLESGQGKVYTDEEQDKINESRAIARAIINHDSDFDTTSSRLMKLDQSLPADKISKNDQYRLEKRLADYILLGDNAYNIITEREQKAKMSNKIDADFYKFFIVRDLNELDKLLLNRTIDLLEKGLILEVIDLIEKDLIPYNFNSIENPIKNIYGIKQSLNLLLRVKKLLNKMDLYIKAFGKDGHKLSNERNNAYKIYFKFVKEYTISNHQYTRQQIKWFKNTENKSCILKLGPNNSSEDIEDSIINISNSSYEEYKRILKKTNDEFNAERQQISVEKGEFPFEEQIVRKNFRNLNFIETLQRTSKITNFLNEYENKGGFSEEKNDSNIPLEAIKKYLV
jgi:tRNA dimethylallyltransferase